MLPLCVDLDGTLVRTDTLHEQLLLAARRPLGLLGALPSLLRGRAAFKAAVARVAPLSAAALPYRGELVEYLREQHASGRAIALVTAAHHSTAQAVADHLGLFQTVLASDGHRNLKGRVKAQALVDRFGERGFVYAGDALADVPVWERAGGAVPVNLPPRRVRSIERRAPVERVFGPGAGPGALVRLLRPHQWAKNGLVALPAVAANQLDRATLLQAALAFLAFSLVASALYIWNDLLDLDADRLHPRKRERPVASGAVAPLTAAALAAALLVAGGGLGAGAAIALPLGAYAVLSVAYSSVLKTFPLVDVFVLAGLYSVRLWGGAVATAIDLSVWLIAFSSFLFLSLAMLKRVGELRPLKQPHEAPSRRGYLSSDLPILTTMGIAASFAAAMVLSLYLQTDAATTQYSRPFLLWFLVPLVLFWTSRLWLATGRGYMHDDPVVYSLRDWVSWLTALAAALTVALAHL